MFLNSLFNTDSIWLLFLELLIGGIIIFYFGDKLAKLGDHIGEKTGLGGTWIGLILLASITSIPEFTTSLSSVLFANEPNLATGNIFGSNVFNLLIIAILDLVEGPGPILRRVKLFQAFPASMGIFLMTLSIVGIAIPMNFSEAQSHIADTLGWLVSAAILVCWLIGMNLIYKFEKSRMQRINRITPPKKSGEYKVYLNFAICALVIIASGIWVVFVVQKIGTHHFHIFNKEFVLGQTFVGTIFLATITSLPELVVSITSFRIGATNMAISNLLGSNTFNILIIPLLEFTTGPHTFFSLIESIHIIPATIAILMTSIALMGLSYRSQKSYLYLGVDAITMIIIFVIGNLIFFRASITLF
ncbi:hypothetical protein JW877_05255 [bacterium]|nr:hypothetical protein [bacterium]